jgi:hypothetical protein
MLCSALLTDPALPNYVTFPESAHCSTGPKANEKAPDRSPGLSKW